jgi:hypothetical protein
MKKAAPVFEHSATAAGCSATPLYSAIGIPEKPTLNQTIFDAGQSFPAISLNASSSSNNRRNLRCGYSHKQPGRNITSELFYRFR